MKITPNYGLKKPEGTDVVNVDDFNTNADVIDGKLKELEINEIFYAVATGSANTYAVSISALNTLSNYFDGLAVCVKINALNTGASTLNVNGWGVKAIVDSLGNPITNGGLKANTPYTLRYNGVNFILQGKGGGGNVTADKLLIGTTATGDSGAIIGTMPDNGAINITPGATAKTIPPGYTSGGTVAGDSNLITGNIKANASIFGIPGKTSIVDTADGTATTGDMLSTKTAYVNGSKVTGSMTNYTADQTATGTALSGTTIGFKVPKGYWDGTKSVNATATAIDSDLVAGNIKSGINLFGIQGSTTVVDTADAVLDPDYLVAGYSGYDDGVKKAGTLANMTSAVNIGGAGATDYTDSAGVCGGTAINSYVGAFDIYIPKGYYSGTGTNRIHIPNLIPANILYGVNIGWNGKSITGTGANGVPSMSGSVTNTVSGTSYMVACSSFYNSNFNMYLFSSNGWGSPNQGIGILAVNSAGIAYYRRFSMSSTSSVNTVATVTLTGSFAVASNSSSSASVLPWNYIALKVPTVYIPGFN